MALKTKPLFPPTAIVEVLWADASVKHGWDLLPSYLGHDTISCRSIGYLLKKSKTAIVVGMTQASDGDMNAAIAIPLEWVKKITVLRK